LVIFAKTKQGFMLNYIIWDMSPEIFRIGFLSIRWYGLLFASGFLLGHWIVSNIFKIEGKSEEDLGWLFIYMIVSTVVGARLGHCLFYQPEIYLANPIEILKVWEGGLASHGAAVGILIALLLYSRKRKKTGQTFLWTVDRVVIVVALGGALIRMGNLMNSEIIGKPSDFAASFVFANTLDQSVDSFMDNENVNTTGITSAQLVKITPTRTAQKDTVVRKTTYTPLKVTFYFKKSADNAQIEAFMSEIMARIPMDRNIADHYNFLQKAPRLTSEREGSYKAYSFEIYGIPRHAAQLYEALSSFLLFIILLALYYRYKAKTPQGLFFGIFMIWIFTLRFFYEFLKENQVEFENKMDYNMGQLLSIPAVLIGVVVIVIALMNAQKQKKASSVKV
jgi:phosphatidylglycerol---prolipoprotein diacylglyceryl transferase